MVNQPDLAAFGRVAEDQTKFKELGWRVGDVLGGCVQAGDAGGLGSSQLEMFCVRVSFL